MQLINRRQARKYALQALYSWKLSQNEKIEIINFFEKKKNINNLSFSYFKKLFIGVIENINYFDKLIKPYIFRDLEKIGYIEHIILYIALFELIKCCYIPYKVIINEAIELTKIFGTEKSYKFINGILDKIVNKNILTRI